MKSMTGFGTASRAFPGGRATVDVRAVNHRFLETKLHLPRGFMAAEAEFRALIAARVERGRVEAFLSLTGRAARSVRVVPNLPLARAYAKAAARLRRELGIDRGPDLQFFLSRADLFQVTEAAHASAAEVRACTAALQAALAGVDRERRREGRFLARDLRQRIRTLQRLRREVARRQQRLQPELHKKLVARAEALLAELEVEPARLPDVASLLHKNDVTEELVRLESHLETCAGFLGLDEAVGKRLDFLLQEMQREVNTIGAKADDAPIRQLVVRMKQEVEKIREQGQNIE